MGMLTGSEIKRKINEKEIEISNFKEDRLNPNSYNLTLSSMLKLYNSGYVKHYQSTNKCMVVNKSIKPEELDAKKDNNTTEILIPESGITLYPGIIYLGSTNEYTKSGNYIPCISGRSSIGRLGINIHATAGFGDIGFCGTWTLEISVIEPVKIYPNMEICQIYFYTPAGSTEIKYKGKYMNQKEPIGSKFCDEFNTIDDSYKSNPSVYMYYQDPPSSIFTPDEIKLINKISDKYIDKHIDNYFGTSVFDIIKQVLDKVRHGNTSDIFTGVAIVNPNVDYRKSYKWNKILCLYSIYIKMLKYNNDHMLFTDEECDVLKNVYDWDITDMDKVISLYVPIAKIIKNAKITDLSIPTSKSKYIDIINRVIDKMVNLNL